MQYTVVCACARALLQRAWAAMGLADNYDTTVLSMPDPIFRKNISTSRAAQDDGLPPHWIAVIAIGTAVVASFAAFLLFVFLRRRRRKVAAAINSEVAAIATLVGGELRTANLEPEPVPERRWALQAVFAGSTSKAGRTDRDRQMTRACTVTYNLNAPHCLRIMVPGRGR